MSIVRGQTEQVQSRSSRSRSGIHIGTTLPGQERVATGSAVHPCFLSAKDRPNQTAHPPSTSTDTAFDRRTNVRTLPPLRKCGRIDVLQNGTNRREMSDGPGKTARVETDSLPSERNHDFFCALRAHSSICGWRYEFSNHPLVLQG